MGGLTTKVFFEDFNNFNEMMIAVFGIKYHSISSFLKNALKVVFPILDPNYAQIYHKFHY